jgi:hypothetical protein
MIALLLATVLHLSPGPHWHPHPPGFGYGYGYGSPFLGYGSGLGLVPGGGLTYINGVPYELIGGQLVAVSIGGIGVL